MNTRNLLRTIFAAALLCCAATCRAQEEEKQMVLPRDITTANLKFNNSENVPDGKSAERAPSRPAVYRSSSSVTKVTYIFVNKDADKKTPARWGTPNKEKKGLASAASSKKGPVVKTVVKKLQVTKSKYAAISLNSVKRSGGDSKLKKPDSSSDLADKIVGGDGGVKVGGK